MAKKKPKLKGAVHIESPASRLKAKTQRVTKTPFGLTMQWEDGSYRAYGRTGVRSGRIEKPKMVDQEKAFNPGRPPKRRKI